jgi:hypothetical protein
MSKVHFMKIQCRYYMIPLQSEKWLRLTSAMTSIFQDNTFSYDNQSTGKSDFIIKDFLSPRVKIRSRKTSYLRCVYVHHSNFQHTWCKTAKSGWYTIFYVLFFCTPLIILITWWILIKYGINTMPLEATRHWNILRLYHR